MSVEPVVSFIIATHNRCTDLLHTLNRIKACGLRRDQYEIWVVDNASTDETSAQVRRRHPDVLLLLLGRNRGSCAKALAAARATGRYWIFLDDDSFPLEDSVSEMIECFEADAALGAVGFVTWLPDGRRECSALPGVFIGCGVGLRGSAVRRAGPLDLSYFMQAEEYDLSFRLVQAGYNVQTFEHLFVLHEKSGTNRTNKNRLYYDVRNNLTLALHYLPGKWMPAYLQDWQQRYLWLAEESGALQEYHQGRLRGLLRGWWRRLTRPRDRLQPAALNTLFGIESIAKNISQLKANGVQVLLLAEWGKNVYAYYHAAVQHGLTVAAIADDRFVAPGRTYRGVPIVSFDQGLALDTEVVVISNSSPVHAAEAQRRLQRRTTRPICRWHSHFESTRRQAAVPH